jgi:hypothetical protein
MTRLSLIVGGSLFCAAVAFATTSRAGPVSDSDLRGKKICWNNGAFTAFGKDGSFDSNRTGHGTWTLTGDLLNIMASNGNSSLLLAGTTTIEKDNQTFRISRNRGELWGNYCN